MQKDYIAIVSPRLVNMFGFLAGVGKKAKAAAFFPFIFFRAEEYMTPSLINHERIHFRQQIETVFIGSYLLLFIERLYARTFLNKSSFEAYLWGSGEQEAYLNQHNPTYLKTRPLWNQFQYLQSKKKISFSEVGEISVK